MTGSGYWSVWTSPTRTVQYFQILVSPEPILDFAKCSGPDQSLDSSFFRRQILTSVDAWSGEEMKNFLWGITRDPRIKYHLLYWGYKIFMSVSVNDETKIFGVFRDAENA